MWLKFKNVIFVCTLAALIGCREPSQTSTKSSDKENYHDDNFSVTSHDRNPITNENPSPELASSSDPLTDNSATEVVAGPTSKKETSVTQVTTLESQTSHKFSPEFGLSVESQMKNPNENPSPELASSSDPLTNNSATEVVAGPASKKETSVTQVTTLESQTLHKFSPEFGLSVESQMKNPNENPSPELASSSDPLTDNSATEVVAGPASKKETSVTQVTTLESQTSHKFSPEFGLSVESQMKNPDKPSLTSFDLGVFDKLLNHLNEKDAGSLRQTAKITKEFTDANLSEYRKNHPCSIEGRKFISSVPQDRSIRDNETVIANFTSLFKGCNDLTIFDCEFGPEFLETLPETITKLKIKFVNMSSEMFNQEAWNNAKSSALANFLRRTPRLEQLELTNVTLEDSGGLEIAEVLKDNVGLKVLKLTASKFGSLAIQKIVAAVLGSNSSLEELAIKSNHTFVLNGLRYLSRALKTNTSLRKLNLSGMFITNTSLYESVIEGLKSNSSLRELVLKDNNINLGGLIVLADALRNHESLQKLDLSGNKLAGCTNEFLAFHNIHVDNLEQQMKEKQKFAGRALAYLLRNNHSLKELRLRKTSLSPLAVKLMADGLTNEQFSLSLLDLSENNIGDMGVEALANTLQDNRTLKELVLDQSQIGTTGARVLADRVATSGSLEVLSLPNNKVWAGGAVALASSLKYKKNSLRVLDLRSNDIEDAGAVALANALRNNTSLKSLNLYNNHVYADGVAALASALQKNTSLQGLHLGLNYIIYKKSENHSVPSSFGVQALADALKVNNSLQILQLAYSVRSHEAQILASGLTNNRSLRVINLLNHNFSSTIKKDLTEAVKGNTSLQYLLLDEEKFFRLKRKILKPLLRNSLDLRSYEKINNSI